MDRAELTKQLIGLNESPLMNLSEIARLCRTSRQRAADMMRGCRCEIRGRGKYFFAADVAEQMLKRMELY